MEAKALVLHQLTRAENALRTIKFYAPGPFLRVFRLRVAFATYLEERKRIEEEGPKEDWDDPLVQSKRAKRLLYKVLRRAMLDWLLYRNSTSPVRRERAQEAYTWIFEEGVQLAAARREEGKGLTSFFTLCEVLDLDPGRIRKALLSGALTVEDLLYDD